jgi:hypothetical protein
LSFFNRILENTSVKEVMISEELMFFFKNTRELLLKKHHLLDGSISDKERKAILDGLGTAGSNYRIQVYEQSFTGKRIALPIKDLTEFSTLCLWYLDHTIRANKRKNNLYHAYNLMTLENENEIAISYLSEMLEGQVTVLSSGYLTSAEALETLDSLKASKLFRKDQYSYLLYPNKDLPGFLQKNHISKKDVSSSALLSELLEKGNSSIIEEDTNGDYHFNGNFKNASDLQLAMETLDSDAYKLTVSNKKEVLEIFEKVFNHKAFTGRSGTFYGYEGLGSIYWHMVSKLLLAVQECCIKAIQDKENEELIGKLLAHYYEINEGIGVHKSPTLYGAFPTDPYSHTPANKGVQQPGMRGQVKEDILSRFGELGVFVRKGQLVFNPWMLRKSEFLSNKQTFPYINTKGESLELPVDENSLVFTYCQVPIVYKLATENSIEVHLYDGTSLNSEHLNLDKNLSDKIFQRSGEMVSLLVKIQQSILK